jgi:hypothetical protein
MMIPRSQLQIAAFMAIGLTTCYQADAALKHWDNGHFEMVDETLAYVDYTERLLKAGLFLNNNEFPGVFDYEVSEPFGAWFASEILLTDESGMAPDPTKSRAKLRALVFDYFRQAEGFDSSTMQLILCAVDVKEPQ